MKKLKGSINALYEKWVEKAHGIIEKANIKEYIKLIQNIVKDFDNVELDETVKKPKVGIVGEILVKFHPNANNDVVFPFGKRRVPKL